MPPSATFGHVPLSRAHQRLKAWLDRKGAYEVEGEKGYTLTVDKERGVIQLKAAKPNHTMKFHWSDEHQDPQPVHISMDIPRVVHAAIQEEENLHLVLLTPKGSVLERFPLPPDLTS